MSSLPCAFFDFETRSTCDIKKTGSWRYSLDPSTEPLCLAFRLPHWEEGVTGIWSPAFPEADIDEYADWELLGELFDWIRDGNLIAAFNAWFERGIYNNIMIPSGWPKIDHKYWRCTAAQCAALALPRSLDKVAIALGLPVQKDSVGSTLMKKMTKPRRPKKAELEAWAWEHCDKPMPTLWHMSQEMLDRLCDYCRMDVLTEEAVGNAIPELPPEEVELYLLDQKINERGIGLDREGIECAMELMAHEIKAGNKELVKLTAGKVGRVSQKARLKVWLEEAGLPLENMQKATLDALDPATLSPTVARVVELVQTLGGASTKKYPAMLEWICPDDRAHGALLYHGASTGRWAGKGIQPHNFPRGTFKHFDMEAAWQVLKSA